MVNPPSFTQGQIFNAALTHVRTQSNGRCPLHSLPCPFLFIPSWSTIDRAPPPNPIPLRLVVLCIRIIRRLPNNLIIHLLLQQEVQDDGQECRDREPGLKDQDDSVEEPSFRPSSLVGKHEAEPVGYEGRTKANGQAGREYEAVTASERYGADDAKTGYRDSGEKKRRHPAENRSGDRDEGSGKLGEEAHDNKKEAGTVPGFAIGAAGKGYDTGENERLAGLLMTGTSIYFLPIVLRKS